MVAWLAARHNSSLALKSSAMDELDVWRTAAALRQVHGDQAAFVAAERSDELFAKDDFIGAAVFHRIVRAIQDLERTKPRDGEATN